MSAQPTLRVESRTQRGSGSAGRFRRQGRIPAIIYGRGESLPVTIDSTEFRHQVSAEQYGSQIVHLFIDGAEGGTALVKAVQVNTLKQAVLNVDLQRVSQQERVNVALAVVLEGEPTAVRHGGILEQLIRTVNVKCRVSEMPQQLTYDVSELEVGEVVHAGQLALPGDCELLDKPDDVIAVIGAPAVPITEEQVEVEPGVSGPELDGGKQKDDFPPER